MREFSFVYGRFRQVPVIVAVLLAGAAIVFFGRADADPTKLETGCGLETTACEPETGPASESDLDGVDAGLKRPATATAQAERPAPLSADWADVADSENDVPFIPLKPSPDAVTDAGRALLAEAEQNREGGGRPRPSPTTATSTPPPTITTAAESGGAGGTIDVGLGA